MWRLGAASVLIREAVFLFSFLLITRDHCSGSVARITVAEEGVAFYFRLPLCSIRDTLFFNRCLDPLVCERPWHDAISREDPR